MRSQENSEIYKQNRNGSSQRKEYEELVAKDCFKKSQFYKFIELGLMSLDSSDSFETYKQQLVTKHGIKDFDFLLNIEPQYLGELGIKRIHQKIFAEGIKKRSLYINSKNIINMTRPDLKAGLSDRWRDAQKLSHKLIESLPQICKYLNTDLIQCQQIIDTLILALFSNQHVLLLGPPGTAKTTIAKRVSNLVSNGSFFYNLMTRFTTPDQIFGPISLPSLKQGQLNRNTNSYLPTATMALLDQIFKSSSIILNSILDILNEREFKNNGKVYKTPILTVIGTSNDEAIAHDLTALFDRFAFRYWTKRLDKKDLFSYLKIVNELVTDNFTSRQNFSWDIPVIIKQTSKNIKIPEYVIKFIVNLVSTLEYDVSERRLKKALEILKVNSKLSMKTDANCLDCLLFKNILAGSEQEIKEFLVKFQDLYIQSIKQVFTEDEQLSEYLGEIHCKKWRSAQDLFRQSLVNRLPSVKQLNIKK